ncbi:putative NAD(P)H-dependent FMN-containing oxidoreductase YwqN [Kroppenstedtia guangzhouensis]|uniref:NAD(P)H-dependent FMN-containing oxidoreductase YwqN n=1 Tax=Kroppenstedtia guangzhouensis TaxID=1274356 RepID=A0ABQ1GZ13_9BACL|nr:flavodoxin family protein [Kroppenstedtia guangzhouensis]GGA53437.1 putative NAD(P)H-dependent FMN-containing oxidoreductase YwqN [Kroppenstedtia guangzhouensis]
MSILALYCSTRRKGNSDLLADIVVEGLDCTKIHLIDHHIEPIRDFRHDPEGFKPVHDDHSKLVREMLKHEILLFATPIYWYGMPGILKNFIDRWSTYYSDMIFKDRMSEKEAIVVVTGGDDPQIKGFPLIQQFYWIFEFMGIEFTNYIIGNGNNPGDILRDLNALSKAEQLNHKLRMRG